jgi:hypothetical protein
MSTTNPNTPLDVIIRNTCANVAILLTKTHNLQVEVSQLRAEQAKLRSVVLTLLADPQAREDALAVLKKFNQERDQ